MEKFGVETDVKIRYLDEKAEKYILNSTILPFLKQKKMLKPYLESSHHVDLKKNGITIEFSCRNKAEIWC